MSTEDETLYQIKRIADCLERTEEAKKSEQTDSDLVAIGQLKIIAALNYTFSETLKEALDKSDAFRKAEALRKLHSEVTARAKAALADLDELEAAYNEKTGKVNRDPEPRYSWTQAICDDCWDKRNPDKLSPRLNIGMQETCAYCGKMAVSGLYVRDDPKNVKHPRVEDYSE